MESLSPHSRRYIIPYNQTYTRRHAIILYNTEKREGAVEEADNMHQALQAAGFHCLQANWSQTAQLSEKLKNIITDILSSCSLLNVCIMCHGHRGTLRGDGGSRLLINDLLNLLWKQLPPHLPLVSLDKSLTPLSFRLFKIHVHSLAYCTIKTTCA